MQRFTENCSGTLLDTRCQQAGSCDLNQAQQCLQLQGGMIVFSMSIITGDATLAIVMPYSGQLSQLKNPTQSAEASEEAIAGDIQVIIR